MKLLVVSLTVCVLVTLSQGFPSNSSSPRHPGLCEYKRQHNHKLIGEFVPQCDANGNFLPQQCSGSTGYCWCVNVITGEEVPDSRTPPGTTHNHCGLCEYKKHHSLNLLGEFVPQCDANGNFLPQQCSGSTGYCWCVNVFSGEEVPDSRTPPGTTHNHCGLCEYEKHHNHNRIGEFVPQCDANGNFLPQQCSGSTGYCWCVNVFSGEEIPDTRTPPGTTPVDCGACRSKKQHSHNRVGEFVPQCDANGNFLPQQCWASTGYCWCVNVFSGDELPDTRTPPGTAPVDCGLCRSKKQHSHNRVGEFVPQCDANGNFRPQQCSGSTGYCWCVNVFSGEEIPDTRRPPGTTPVDCGLCRSKKQRSHNLLGEFVPKCDANGNFLPQQCSGSTGYCWCVNVFSGEEVPDSRTPPGTAPVDCGLCRSKKPHSHNRIGEFVPHCDANGNFLPQQCSGSTGYCWCVNVFSGEEIPDTRTPPGTAPVNCDNKFSCPSGWSSFGKRCFIFINSSKTWVESESYCLFEEANLASVHSAEENHFIQSLTRGGSHDFPETWIGGHDGVHACFWMWSDGSKFNYDNWYDKAETKTAEYCLKINYGSDHKWNYNLCNRTLPFVCAKMV